MGKIKIYVLFIGLLAAFPAFAVDPVSAGIFLASITGATISMTVATAAAFVANYAISTIINRVFSKKPPTIQDNGVRQQIPPSSTNSIPIVYGSAFLGGTFVDAALTTDQKAMMYVIAISHISPDGQFTYDTSSFYYGDRLITFVPNTPYVQSLTDGSGNVDTKIFGNLTISLFTSDQNGNITNHTTPGLMPWGAGLDVMGAGSGLPVNLQWPSTGRRMNGLAFAIVRLAYSQEDETVQLQQLTFKVNHALYGTGVAKPGDVWYDYIRNPIYGGAIADSLVDNVSPYNLSVYSDQLITFTNNQGNPATQPRYRINGVLDTGTTILENLDKILMAADSWMAYDAPSGKWSIVINKAEASAFSFNDTNIIGDIKVGTVDINQAINQIEARFPSSLNKDIPDYVFLSTPNNLLYPNEPVNKYTLSLDLVNDSVQAQYLCNRMLEQAREDLIVLIKTTYAGIQINAGDVVGITNSSYGWSNKLFRVTKVNEASLPDGSLGASLELNEYNAQVYDDKPITEFQPAPNSDIPNPGYFSALSAPTVGDQQPNAAVPSFSVTCTIPATGRVTIVYLYYTVNPTPSTSDWILLGVETASDSRPFTNSSSLKFSNIILPTATYYFAYKVANDQSTSILSPLSASYNWLPNPASSAVAGTFVATFSPPVEQVPYDGVTPDFTSIAPQLYGTTAGGSVDYVAAATDADPLFVNNSWRIGGSSTTGLGDIIKTNITIGNPTDGGNYAQFPQPTAQAANNATIDVPVRYKDTNGNVVQGATAILSFVYAIQGATGTAGNKNAIAYLYQWSTVQPGNPNGNSTYTWATNTNSAYTGTNGWVTSIPANPGTPLIQLWSASKGITAAGSAVTTTVDWTSGYSVQAVGQNGATGASGTQAANPTVYQWAITIPAGPVGTSTYTWATNTFTPTPSSWSLTPGTPPSDGYTLWAAVVNLIDSATATTSTINWSTASISGVGYSGQNGSSARICYSKTSLSALATSPSTITTAGNASFPPNGSWGADTVWQATAPAISAGESVYQSDGIYSPATNQTTWNVPYLSNLKVGELSAITVNTGGLTVSNFIRGGSSPVVSGSSMTGSGFVLNSTGSFAFGNSTKNLSFDGSTLTMNGDLIVTGNIQAGAVTAANIGSGGSALLPAGGPYQLLNGPVSISYTGTGGSGVIISFSVLAFCTVGNAQADLRLDVRRNGISIGIVGISVQALTTLFTNIAYDATPGVNPYYELYAQNYDLSGSDGIAVTSSTMVLQGGKR